MSKMELTKMLLFKFSTLKGSKTVNTFPATFLMDSEKSKLSSVLNVNNSPTVNFYSKTQSPITSPSFASNNIKLSKPMAKFEASKSKTSMLKDSTLKLSVIPSATNLPNYQKAVTTSLTLIKSSLKTSERNPLKFYKKVKRKNPSS